MRSNKFTLTELIAVLGVTGLLTILAIPAFQKAKQSSDYSGHLNNFKQLEMAVHQYSSDVKTDYHIKNPHANCNEEKEKHSASVKYITNAEDLCKSKYVDHKYIQSSSNSNHKD